MANHRFLLQCPVLSLKLFDSFTKVVHLLLGRCAELLNDLEYAPEPEDHYNRSYFFQNPFQAYVNDEARDDDSGVKAVEAGFEIAIKALSVS